jgi:hypothetical protein
MSENAIALVEMFRASLLDDAAQVVKAMTVPAVLRLRADEEKDSGAQPLLAMRLARLGMAREKMKSYAATLIEGEPPLDSAVQKDRLRGDMRRALESCIRVLECTDEPGIKQHVVEAALAMSNSMGVIATILSARPDADLASYARDRVIDASNIGGNVDKIASDLKAVYARIRVTLAQSGPRQEVEKPTVAPAI